MRHIYFVRHAESQGNIDGFEISDEEENTLTDLGRTQALQFAQSWTNTPDCIVASSYTRAQQTAQPLRDKFTIARYEEWDSIQEFHYLKKCVSFEEKNKRKKDFWNTYDPNFRDAENMETFSELILRVDKTLGRITQVKDSSIVVFSHAKFMRTLILRLIHTKDVDHSKLMKMLTTYSFRFGYCDTLELCVDKDSNIYIRNFQ